MIMGWRSLNRRWAQMEQKMKAVVRDAYGSVDVLRIAVVDKPIAGDGEVLVRVHAAGVDQGISHLMVGKAKSLPRSSKALDKGPRDRGAPG
jgi:hypothetical protein